LFAGRQTAFLTRMNLETALKNIKECFEKMNALYGKVVFDEWVVLSFSAGKESVLSYSGPRRQHFKDNFANDVVALRKELHAKKHPVGDFDFARAASGTHFDAFMVIGEELFLICNSTNLSVQEIAKNERWLTAQVPFAELTDKFRADPLEASGPGGLSSQSGFFSRPAS
jgi:hypothetical protein